MNQQGPNFEARNISQDGLKPDSRFFNGPEKLFLNKNTGGKKLPGAKIFLASLSLLGLVAAGKYVIVASSAKTFKLAQAAPKPVVLGQTALSNQTLTAQVASTTPLASTPVANPGTAAPAPVRKSVQSKKSVKIKETPTGYLNARSQPAVSGSVIGKAYPGQTYNYTGEEDGWYRIRLKSGEYAWVDGEYVSGHNSNADEE
ncbi:MAG: SH3 domain-containing protein [Patescibacteria group bacterium]|nr:SH3 domain-containing protein [Patescibacteria group bacterium]